MHVMRKYSAKPYKVFAHIFYKELRILNTDFLKFLFINLTYNCRSCPFWFLSFNFTYIIYRCIMNEYNEIEYNKFTKFWSNGSHVHVEMTV